MPPLQDSALHLSDARKTELESISLISIWTKFTESKTFFYVHEVFRPLTVHPRIRRIFNLSFFFFSFFLVLNVDGGVDIKILWWIHNRLIVHDKIFVIKLISNWWRGQSANEIKPRGKIKWRKPYGSIGRKDLYGKFLLNEIPN